jgi:hypothetical protein
VPIPQWFAGQILTADDMNVRHARLVVQQNDQIVSNSTTLVDTEISFVPEPNATFYYELFISYSAVEGADLKWAWNAPGAPLASFTMGYAASAATTSSDTGSLIIFRRPGNTTARIAGGTDGTSPPSRFHSAYDRGTFSTDGTTSPVTLQFAQNTANAGQTILRGGNQSRLIYWRIG